MKNRKNMTESEKLLYEGLLASADRIVENFSSNQQKSSMLLNQHIPSPDSNSDSFFLIEKLRTVATEYQNISTEYLSIVKSILDDLKEVNNQLTRGESLKNVDSLISKLSMQRNKLKASYDELILLTERGRKLVKDIDCSISNLTDEHQKDYKTSFYEVIKLWDQSKDQFKGISGNNQYSEYYFINEIINCSDDIKNKLKNLGKINSSNKLLECIKELVKGLIKQLASLGEIIGSLDLKSQSHSYDEQNIRDTKYNSKKEVVGQLKELTTEVSSMRKTRALFDEENIKGTKYTYTGDTTEINNDDKPSRIEITKTTELINERDDISRL